jgi:oxygen-independent coproporphyrinogen-3 oxidase
MVGEPALGAFSRARRYVVFVPGVGVYIHVPFCERICPYCDFAVVARKRLSSDEEEGYLTALLEELRRRAACFEGHRLETIYLGGGTPSLLKARSIARLIGAVRQAFPGEPRELTLEVNPSTLEASRLSGFRRAGVNRLSLGIQSFDDGVLKRLGRAHRSEEAISVLRQVRGEGFDNLSLDLIYAAPGQTFESLDRDLDLALSFDPEHISAYTLTVESGTPFATAQARGQLQLPEEELGLAMLERVWARLERAGYRHYELSNFAKPGFASLHNRRYWHRRPVLALGVGACSFDPKSARAPYGARPENPRRLDAYLAGAAPDAANLLSRDEAASEAIFLALRTARGLGAEGFLHEFGERPRFFVREAHRPLVDAGLLVESAREDWRLSDRGRRVADGVLLELL